MMGDTRAVLEPQMVERASEPAQKSPMVSVIVPVTERPSPLEWLYNEYAPAFKTSGVPFEFIFVLEPWGMKLAKGLSGLVASGEPIRLYEVGQNVGESAMLEAARLRTRGDIILTLPAYPRILPDGLIDLVRAVEQGADLASARRISAQRSVLSRIQGFAFHGLLRLGLPSSLHDVASGVRAMRREVLEEVPVYGDLFRFLPVLAQSEGFRVQEVPVSPHDEDRRARVYSPGVYLRRLIDLLGLFFLVRFTRKPLRFFGLLGGVVSAVGAVILLVLFVERLGGRSVADRPLLLLGVLTLVLGVQAIAIGLVGEIIVHLSPKGGRKAYRIRADLDI